MDDAPEPRSGERIEDSDRVFVLHSLKGVDAAIHFSPLSEAAPVRRSATKKHGVRSAAAAGLDLTLSLGGEKMT